MHGSLIMIIFIWDSKAQIFCLLWINLQQNILVNIMAQGESEGSWVSIFNGRYAVLEVLC